MPDTKDSETQGRAAHQFDEQLQRKQQEKAIDPGKADDEAKAARAEEQARREGRA